VPARLVDAAFRQRIPAPVAAPARPPPAGDSHSGIFNGKGRVCLRQRRLSASVSSSAPRLQFVQKTVISSTSGLPTASTEVLNQRHRPMLKIRRRIRLRPECT
jgi:hypothetical protein